MDSQLQLQRWKEIAVTDQQGLYKNGFINYFFKLGHSYLAKQVKKIPHPVVLDFGCGNGEHFEYENFNTVKKYVAADIDSHKINNLQITHSNFKKIHLTKKKLPFQNNTFDIVLVSHVLEHIPDLEDTLIELKRILKKDGILAFALPCDPGFLWNLGARFTPSRKRLAQAGLNYDLIMKHEHVQPITTILELISKHSQKVHLRYFPFIIPSHHCNLVVCGSAKIKK